MAKKKQSKQPVKKETPIDNRFILIEHSQRIGKQVFKTSEKMGVSVKELIDLVNDYVNYLQQKERAKI
jgi:hypothetical protein